VEFEPELAGFWGCDFRLGLFVVMVNLLTCKFVQWDHKKEEEILIDAACQRLIFHHSTFLCPGWL
jgi:hypothetical protein